MSNWGPGNFDNKPAMDFAQQQVDQLSAALREGFEEEGMLGMHVESDDWMIQSLEIIHLLCSRYDLTPPQPVVLGGWREQFIECYDQQPGFGGQTRQRKQRREVILRTFDQLSRLAREQWHLLVY